MPPPSALAAATFFTGAGTMHFARPDFFESIVPDWFPNSRLANSVTGVAEVVLGVGLLPRRTRRAAAVGLIGLLVIVFPANVDMAANRVEVKTVDGRFTRSVGTARGPLNWIRLPLQLPLLWWMCSHVRSAR